MSSRGWPRLPRRFAATVEHPRPASRGRRVSAPSSSNHAGTAAWSTSIRRHTLPSGEPSRHYRAGRCSPTCEATGAQAVSPGSGPPAAPGTRGRRTPPRRARWSCPLWDSVARTGRRCGGSGPTGRRGGGRGGPTLTVKLPRARKR